jgi:DNA anti-recombination protein RmuC
VKHILKRLLEAEETGRHEAARLEAAGEELLRQAAAERDALVARIRSETVRQIDELKAEITARVEQERKVIARGAAETVQRIQTEAAGRRQAAVDRVVAILLGETSS